MEKALGPEGVRGGRGECILKIVFARGGGGGTIFICDYFRGGG